MKNMNASQFPRNPFIFLFAKQFSANQVNHKLFVLAFQKLTTIYSKAVSSYIACAHDIACLVSQVKLLQSFNLKSQKFCCFLQKYISKFSVSIFSVFLFKEIQGTCE